MQARLAAARVQCEQRGTRFTPMRARVLELLLQHNRFATAYELPCSILETHPCANLATVYRILGLLMTVAGDSPICVHPRPRARGRASF
ncbi:transcriptional repressor [Trinickia sp.]|uniref:transcriptional repressor n=1 Tax=Trinickia sp. TaxID=2571163 RepID=UPI0039C9F06C